MSYVARLKITHLSKTRDRIERGSLPPATLQPPVHQGVRGPGRFFRGTAVANELKVVSTDADVLLSEPIADWKGAVSRPRFEDISDLSHWGGGAFHSQVFLTTTVK